MAAICICIKTKCRIIRRTRSTGNKVVVKCIDIDFLKELVVGYFYIYMYFMRTFLPHKSPNAFLLLLCFTNFFLISPLVTKV